MGETVKLHLEDFEGAPSTGYFKVDPTHGIIPVQSESNKSVDNSLTVNISWDLTFQDLSDERLIASIKEIVSSGQKGRLQMRFGTGKNFVIDLNCLPKIKMPELSGTGHFFFPILNHTVLQIVARSFELSDPQSPPPLRPKPTCPAR